MAREISTGITKRQSKRREQHAFRGRIDTDKVILTGVIADRKTRFGPKATLALVLRAQKADVQRRHRPTFKSANSQRH